MRFTRYTKEQFITAIISSTSIAQVLIKLGLKPRGGNYRVIKNYIKQLNLDISHFTGQSWNKGKKIGPKRDIQVYLSNEQSIQSHDLRQRLLSEGIFEYRCSNCQNTEWLGKPIPLELEHKNGNHSNNNLSNLCLLCPNCHALTPTYRGRNKKFRT